MMTPDERIQALEKKVNEITAMVGAARKTIGLLVVCVIGALIWLFVGRGQGDATVEILGGTSKRDLFEEIQQLRVETGELRNAIFPPRIAAIRLVHGEVRWADDDELEVEIDEGPVKRYRLSPQLKVPRDLRAGQRVSLILNQVGIVTRIDK